MSIRLALAGNPNCGKTTMFNDLTGATQYVGNWPGVTVEKKEGKFKGDKEVLITDLPGIYSLSPYTLEEVVARDYLVNEKPQAIMNLVDASNIERNLYLTTQLLEMGIPVVIALNMMDIVKKRGDVIDVKKLSQELGVPVVETAAIKGEGTKELVEAAKKAAKAGNAPAKRAFEGTIENAVTEIEKLIADVTEPAQRRWFAVKLFERDDKVMDELKLSSDLTAHIDQHIKDCEAEMDDDAESIITNQRYAYINTVVGKAVKKKARVEHLTVSDKIDRIVTNRVLALPIFAVVMYLMYSLSMGTSIADGGWAIGTFATDWTNDVLFGEIVPNALGGFLESIGVAGWLYGLIMDGIVAGVGAVLGFVPQMLVLFFLLSILEDVGYMSRVAFIMDRIFRKFGLSGKSFIPMLIGTGCGVPGIMASRTIEKERDRRMTILLTPFMSCSAKLPIYALFTAAFFPRVWRAPVMIFLYLFGILCGILYSLILKQTCFRGEPVPFVMELPNYRLPSPKSVGQLIWEKARDFIQRAFTIIFVATVVIWFLQTFDTRLNVAATPDSSLLALVGSLITPIFKPLGFGDWRISTALITGFTAKESVVSTLTILFGSSAAFAAALTPAQAAPLLVFCLLYTPCIAAVASVKRELGGKWASIMVVNQCVTAWLCALVMRLILLAI